MSRFIPSTSRYVGLAAALVLGSACQLNDTDSAPPAPDNGDLESSPSAAQEGTVGTRTQSPRDVASGSSDASVGDAGSSSASSDAGSLRNDAGSFINDAGSFVNDAGGVPTFPPLPIFDAGVLPPGMLTQGDAALAQP